MLIDRTLRSVRASREPMQIAPMGTVNYHTAWETQHRLVEERAADVCADTLLLIEHPFVYTAGSATQPEDLPIDGAPVIQVDRGERITWHGPGQLVGYLILRLAAGCSGVDVVRRVEDAVLDVMRQMGLPAQRVAGRSGVWLPEDAGKPGTDRIERKIAAVGMRVTRGVTFHGFSINCNNSFDGFDSIIPCGIQDAGVTSLSRELNREVTVAEVLPLVVSAIRSYLDGQPYSRT